MFLKSLKKSKYNINIYANEMLNNIYPWFISKYETIVVLNI